MPATITADQLPFGVELEGCFPDAFQVRMGTQSDYLPDGWIHKWDGSIRPGARFYGVETTSPKIEGFDGLAQVVYAADFLKLQGARANRSCGLHVHVDAAELSADRLVNLAVAFPTVEAAFYALSGPLAPNRWANGYCRPSTLWEPSGERSERYRSLNLTNWFNRPDHPKRTVEFRLWAGTFTAETIVAAVHMAVGIVAAAYNDTLPDGPREAIVSSAIDRLVADVWSRPENVIKPELGTAQLLQILRGKAAEAPTRLG